MTIATSLAGPFLSEEIRRMHRWFMALLYFNLQRWLHAVLFDEVARVD